MCVRNVRSVGYRFVLAVTLAVLAAGCGRHATRDDCQLIVELQMRDSDETDAQAIAKRAAQVRAELDDEINSCQRDRRVTDKIMGCVQSAKTTAELDACLK